MPEFEVKPNSIAGFNYPLLDFEVTYYSSRHDVSSYRALEDAKKKWGDQYDLELHSFDVNDFRVVVVFRDKKQQKRYNRRYK